MPIDNSWSQENVKATLDHWELTDAERKNFSDLRDRLKDVKHWKNCPDTLVRFQRARPGDVAAAETLFRDMVRWRLDNKADTILEDYKPPRLLMDYYPGAVLKGLDKDGDPVFVGRLGVTDGVGLLEKYGEEEMIRHAIWIRELASRGEWLNQFEREHGRPIKRITLIEDLEGLSRRVLSSRMLSFYGKIMRLDQDNYCESCKKLIIVRAPTVFRMAWSLAKHFFDTGVVAKMVFSGSSNYLQVLDQYVDRKILPSAMCPEGQGEVIEGMPDRFEGGLVPTDDEGKD